MNRLYSYTISGGDRSIGLPALLLLFLISSATLVAQSSDSVTLRITPDCWVTDEGANNAFLIIYPDGISDSVITIRMRVGGTATKGSDHHQSDTILVLEPDGSGAFLFLPMIDDMEIEAIETMELRFTVVGGPARLVDTTPLRIYLLDNDSPSRNLLADPGFESEPTGWTIDAEGVSVATDQTKSGTRSLKLEASDQSARRARQDVAVVPGTLYLYHANRMVNGIDATGLSTELVWFDAAGAEIDRQPVMSLFGSTGPPGWSSTSGCVVAPEGAVIARFLLSIPIEPDNLGAVWFDDLGLIPMGESSDVRERAGEGVRLDLSMNGDQQ